MMVPRYHFIGEIFPLVTGICNFVCHKDHNWVDIWSSLMVAARHDLTQQPLSLMTDSTNIWLKYQLKTNNVCVAWSSLFSHASSVFSFDPCFSSEEGKDDVHFNSQRPIADVLALGLANHCWPRPCLTSLLISPVRGIAWLVGWDHHIHHGGGAS